MAEGGGRSPARAAPAVHVVPHEIERSLANFNRLRPETAEKAMRFYRLRERAGKSAAR
jgi:hypothetical protein